MLLKQAIMTTVYHFHIYSDQLCTSINLVTWQRLASYVLHTTGKQKVELPVSLVLGCSTCERFLGFSEKGNGKNENRFHFRSLVV